MSNQYWADAATRNCVWLCQHKTVQYGAAGCTCGKADEDTDCECGVTTWNTHTVRLTRQEAWDYCFPKNRNGDEWRPYGVPCEGLMAELLGKHIKEFESEVEYIG